MIAFMEWIQSFSTPFLDWLFLMITNLANEMLFVFIVVVIYWCISKEKGFAMVCALLFSGFINIDLKELFQIPRPFQYSNVIQKDLHTGYGYSFPSAHSQLTASFFTCLNLAFHSRWLLVLGCCVTLLIGFSRIYLGVHTPLDVFCGILLGIIVAIAVQRMTNHFLCTKKGWMSYFFLIPGIVGTLVTNDPDIAKATFLLLGFLCGYSLEQRYVHFSVQASFTKQLWKVAIGFCLILAIQFTLKLLGDTVWWNHTRYFLIGFAITFLCPWIFQQKAVRSS